jgi:hypothetical protein
LREAPQLDAPGCRRRKARRGSRLQRRNMAGKCRVGGQAEDPNRPGSPGTNSNTSGAA